MQNTKTAKPLTVVVIAKNEADLIGSCLSSVRSISALNQIMLIDDNSTDNTIVIARKHGARIIKHALSDFSAQRNYALTLVSTDWVLFVDADEVVSHDLAKEIDNFFVDTKRYAGGVLKRYDYFIDRWLKYGEIAGIKLVRLGKKNTGKWTGKVDERWIIPPPIYEFNNPLLHYSHPNLPQFIDNINVRSSLNAQALFDNGVKLRWYDWLKPLAKFIHSYLLRLGFLDGLHGLIFAILMSFHSFLVRGKLYLLWKRKS